LIPHIKLHTFYEALARMKVLNEQGRSPDFVPSSPDKTFKSLIESQKPTGEYYHQTFGDKLLYLRRVDQLNYDVAAAEKEKIEAKMLSEFDKFKLKK
jgi:hypothetical protein